jgi:tetratricopeptide (TPR) repeat protein
MRNSGRFCVVLCALVVGLGALSPGAWAQGTGGTAVQQLLQDGDKYYDQGEFKKAAANYDRAIQAEPNGIPAGAFAKRASIFLVQNEPGPGISWITNTAEKIHPKDDQIRAVKALLLSKMPGKKHDAVTLAEAVVKGKPGEYAHALYLVIGDFYYNAGSGGAAKTAAAYEAYLKARPESVAQGDKLIRIKLGFAQLYVANFTAAEAQFNAVLKTAGDDATFAPNARKGLCAAYSGALNWDKALTVCEKVIKDKKALKGDPSTFYNVGLAYLNRGRFDDANFAANSYLQARPSDPKGYLLRGKVYFAKARWNDAEGQYLKAKQLAPKNSEVAKALGRVHQKQGKNKQAIQELTEAASDNPGDLEVIEDLALAFLADGQPKNAATLAAGAVSKVPEGARDAKQRTVRLRMLAALGHYKAGALGDARSEYTQAYGLDTGNAEVRVGLVNTINGQSAAKFQKGDHDAAEKLLREAYAIDQESINTNFNLGLVAIQKQRFTDALKFLGVRYKKTPEDLLTNRLLAKAYLNAGNPEKASEFYEKSEEQAKKLRNLPILSEIYTEWGPLLLSAGKSQDAVEKLELAAQYASNQAFEKGTKRNLQVAYFRRGYERLKAKKYAEAVADLEGATREPALLRGQEEAVFSFALGLSYLGNGQAAKAVTLFQALAQGSGSGPAGKAQAVTLPWLRDPYDKIGAELFLAYAFYREGSGGSRAKAAPVFERLLGRAPQLVGKLKELLRSTWEYLAYDQFVKGQSKEAESSLKKAGGYAQGDIRAIDHNGAVLLMDKKADTARSTLERLGDNPPESIVNLGILADRSGDPKKAYELWQQARARGARVNGLDEWINAKKRIFGY